MSTLARLDVELNKPARLLTTEECLSEEKRERLQEAFRHLRKALSGGLAEMSSQDMRALVKPVFVPTITTWTPSSGNLLLLGDTGAGKSISAAFIFKRYVLTSAGKSQDGLSDALRARWFTARAIGVARREESLGRSVDVLEKAKRASLLIIDDVGQDNNREDFFDIMDHRYFRGHPTIITSGLTSDAMEKRFGAELWRRMTHCANKRATIAEHWGKR